MTTKKQTVYFAYGSNLHLAQMAKRCPESRYLGRGRLHGYKWQINGRGYANILESRCNLVEGLCYLLSLKDEGRLDKYEGVASQAYQKTWLQVEVFASSPTIAGRRVKEVNEYISAPHEFVTLNFSSSQGESIECLVYIDSTVVGHGQPKFEYISRIKSGLEDAKALGVSSSYFEVHFRGPMGWPTDQDNTRKSVEALPKDEKARKETPREEYTPVERSVDQQSDFTPIESAASREATQASAEPNTKDLN